MKDVFFFKEIEKDRWPKDNQVKRVSVFLSGYFLCQVFAENDGVFRISINKTIVGKDKKWKDGITWDELQAIKDSIGFSDYYAVEIYPKNNDIVNVANMRHLWVLPEPLSIGWFKS